MGAGSIVGIIGGPLALVVAVILIASRSKEAKRRDALATCLNAHVAARMDVELALRLYKDRERLGWVMMCRHLAVNGQNPILRSLIETPDAQAEEVFTLTRKKLQEVFNHATIQLEVANSYFPSTDAT